MDGGILRSNRREPCRLLTAPLVRAARAGLGLSMLDLARAAGASVSLVSRVERGLGDGVDEAAMDRLREALQAAGAEFIHTDAGEVVGFRTAAD